EPYTARLLDACPGLRVIARVGVGYDAVDLAAATARGVVVTITPGANHDAVAEHTLCLILGLAKNIAGQHNSTRAGRWERGITRPAAAAPLGRAGRGRMGRGVARRAGAFGMRVLAYAPSPARSFAAAHGVEFEPFARLLAESDYLSLPLPLTPESRHL